MAHEPETYDQTSSGEDSGRPDWLIPAILVGFIVLVALFVGVVLGARGAGSDDDAVAVQLERWSSCLRSEGANVPLVESLRDGGFRITVDGSLVEEGIDTEALGPALEACEEDAPDYLRRMMLLLEGLSEFPFR